VEAVSGALPFSADTTLGMLAARTQQPLTAPEELGPLAPAIDRAGAIDPDERYPNAATMRAALADAGDELPPPGPLTLAGMVDRADPHPTRAVPTGGVATGAPPTRATPPRHSRLFDQDAAEVLAEPQTEPIPEITVEPAPPRRPWRTEDTENGNRQRRLVPFVVGLVLLITVAIATAALARVGGASPISVPTLVGLAQQDALDAARARGLVASVGGEQASPDPPGQVIAQSPEQGTLTTGRRIKLTVSKGPAPVEVPALVGFQWKEAEQQLKAAHWLYTTKQQYDETHEKGIVLSTTPAHGQPVSPDTKLLVLVSNGHAPVKVPDESNQTYDAAKAELEAKHFTVPAAVEDFSTDVAKDKVIKTEPPAGAQAPYGSAVTVHVSKGPDLVTVPNLINRTLDDASRALDKAGLSLLPKGKYRAGDLVSRQNPNTGDKVKRGSDVEVWFSRNGCIFNDPLFCM
jgi:serine/threonine-protein kinase